MATSTAQQYRLIPLSLQDEGDGHIVGNPETGDFYKVPEIGVSILRMLDSGESIAEIKCRLGDEAELVDVDTFVTQMAEIGFIHPKGEMPLPQQRAQTSGGRIFNVDQRLARAIFSRPLLAGYLAIVVYAFVAAVRDPALRLNTDALYVEHDRTLLLVLVLAFASVQTVLHELGHMLAAARHGITSRYGIGNRLWTIVAESDLTGILALPRAQRYLPMLAGMLVDVLSLSLLTIALDVLRRHGAGAFCIQVIQVMVLETVIGLVWQFNVFVKTDIYFVLCNYFGQPDLDRDARSYLHGVVYRMTFGHFGRAWPKTESNLLVLRVFAMVWAAGRIMSLVLLFTVFLPTMWQYLGSAADMLRGPPTSVYAACDTIIYVSILLTMLTAGMYMWLRHRPVKEAGQ
ncbi:MAG TPA: hypothetical protein VFL55_06590 [Acetobacteraceae bacterium]|nr:hypothetical protein [Acetobacteraceae bacterium]